jgi:hypothetical protein
MAENKGFMLKMTRKSKKSQKKPPNRIFLFKIDPFGQRTDRGGTPEPEHSEKSASPCEKSVK